MAARPYVISSIVIFVLYHVSYCKAIIKSKKNPKSSAQAKLPIEIHTFDSFVQIHVSYVVLPFLIVTKTAASMQGGGIES